MTTVYPRSCHNFYENLDTYFKLEPFNPKRGHYAIDDEAMDNFIWATRTTLQGDRYEIYFKVSDQADGTCKVDG